MTLEVYNASLNNRKNDAAVIYASEIEAICKLPTVEEREEAFRLFLLQALQEKKIQSDNYAINMLLTCTYQSQISRQQRHKKAVSDGKQGGRPPSVDRDKVFELRRNGLTQQQIANELDCHVNTVRNVLQDQDIYPQKPTITNNNHVSVGANSDFLPTKTYNNQQKPLDKDIDREIDREKEQKQDKYLKGDRQLSDEEVEALSFDEVLKLQEEGKITQEQFDRYCEENNELPF